MVNVKNKKITFLLFFVLQFSLLSAQIKNESLVQEQSIQKKLESYIKLKENKDLKQAIEVVNAQREDADKRVNNKMLEIETKILAIKTKCSV